MKYNNIFILLLIFLIPISSAFGEEHVSKSNGLESDYILNVHTESLKYLTGHIPVIFGTIYDNQTNPDTKKIKISITNDKQESVYETSVLAMNGTFRHVGFSSFTDKEYTIKVSIIDGTFATTKIKFYNMFDTNLGYGLVATVIVIFLLLLMIIISQKYGAITTVEPIRFALITLCFVIPIATLIMVDVQVGQNGIAGIVIQEISKDAFASNIQNSLLPELSPDSIEPNHFHWIIHFGGNAYDNYQSGITVPTYILFFGMIGGLLRFLYKTQGGWFIQRAIYEIKRTKSGLTDTELKKEAGVTFVEAEKGGDKSALVRRIIFNNSMEDLSLIFLPPILAIASYFLLLQGDVKEDAWPTFALVSFAIGLVTNEIISKLKSFVISTVDSAVKKDDTTQPKPSGEGEEVKPSGEGEEVKPSGGTTPPKPSGGTTPPKPSGEGEEGKVEKIKVNKKNPGKMKPPVLGPEGKWYQTNFRQDKEKGNVIDYGEKYLWVKISGVKSYVTVILRNAKREPIQIDMSHELDEDNDVETTRLEMFAKDGKPLPRGKYFLQTQGDRGSSDAVGIKTDEFMILVFPEIL